MNDGDMSVLSNKVSTMQSKLNDLREREENLDRLCKAMRENYKQARKSPENEFYAYVTRDDLLQVFGDDSVILTARNCDTVQTGKSKDEKAPVKHKLRVHGRWKKVDMRLVTTNGEIANTDQSDDTEMNGEKLKSDSAGQQVPSNVIGNRRPGRRRKPERFELKDEDSNAELDLGAKKHKLNLTEEESELEERRLTAEALLGYRPAIKQRKRNFEEDWLQRKQPIIS